MRQFAGGYGSNMPLYTCVVKLWWIIKGIRALFSLLFIFMWNRKPWLDNFMFIITLECSKLWIWMGIYFRDILLIRISRGTNNCVQRVFEKKHLFHNEIFPHFQLFLFNERLDFCGKKRSKGLIMQVYFQSLLWSYLPRVPTILTTSVYIYTVYIYIYIYILQSVFLS